MQAITRVSVLSAAVYDTMMLSSFAKDKKRETVAVPRSPGAMMGKAGTRTLFAISLLLLIAAIAPVGGRLSAIEETLPEDASGSTFVTIERGLGIRESPQLCFGDSFHDGNDNDLEIGEAICEDDGARFGLNSDGYLGLWDKYDNVVWWPGKKGTRLVLQTGDSHLVLYDRNSDEWATGCYGRGDGMVVYFTAGGDVEVKDTNGNIAWRLDDDGSESNCYPDGGSGSKYSPPSDCKGSSRNDGNDNDLEEGEAICRDGVRFGLNDHGYLALWDKYDDVVWWPGVKGTRLVLQTGDSHLVLYDGNSDAWATGCYGRGEGKKFYVTTGGDVVVEDTNGEVVWRLDYDGSESDCYPY